MTIRSEDVRCLCGGPATSILGTYRCHPCGQTTPACECLAMTPEAAEIFRHQMRTGPDDPITTRRVWEPRDA